MKKLTLSKLGCTVIVGLAMPLAANAYDEHDRIQKYLGGEGVNASSGNMATKADTQERWSEPQSQGAQGPIRSDMTEDKALDNEKATGRRQMEHQLFPLNAPGG